MGDDFVFFCRMQALSPVYKLRHNKKSEINQKRLQRPAAGGNSGSNRLTQNINTWLQNQCLCQNFGVLNHGRAFKRQGMLGPGGIHLSWWVKCIFESKLVGLIERALSLNQWGKGILTGLQ